MAETKQIMYTKDNRSLLNQLEPVSATAFFIAALKYLSSREYRIKSSATDKENEDFIKILTENGLDPSLPTFLYEKEIPCI